MFAKLFTFLFITASVASAIAQVGGSSAVEALPKRSLQTQAIYSSFGDAPHHPVRQAIWQTSDSEIREPVQQPEQDLPKRRESLVDQNSKTTGDGSGTDDYQLPQLANVRDPIALAPLSTIYQNDPSNLLKKRSPHQEAYMANHMSYANLAGTMPIPAAAHWVAPNFYHRPLLFEETNLERYGNKRCFQPLRSAAHFFGTIPVLPYKLGKHGCRYRDYTLRHHRPGDCVPYEVDRFQFDVHGGFWQALVTAAVVIP